MILEPETEKAKEHLLKAIKINPSYSKAYYKLGILLVQDSEYRDAMKNFENAIKFDGKFAEAHFQVALLLMNKDAQKELGKNEKKMNRKKTVK